MTPEPAMPGFGLDALERELHGTLGAAARPELRPGFSARLERALAEDARAQRKRRALRGWMALYWLGAMIATVAIVGRIGTSWTSGIGLGHIVGVAAVNLVSAGLYWLVTLRPITTFDRRF